MAVLRALKCAVATPSPAPPNATRSGDIAIPRRRARVLATLVLKNHTDGYDRLTGFSVVPLVAVMVRRSRLMVARA